MEGPRSIPMKKTDADEGIPGFERWSSSQEEACTTQTNNSASDWTTASVQLEKRRIVQEIEAILHDGDGASQEGLKAALQHMLENIGHFATAPSPTERLRSVLFSIGALRQNIDFGGLTQTQCEHLAEVAQGLIKTQGIEAGSSKLAFLYGDLHLVQAQGEQKAGKLWESALTQQLSHHLARRQPAGGLGFQALAAALRALRMGHAELATIGLTAAEEQGLSDDRWELARLSRIMALRLKGEHRNATELILATQHKTSLSNEAALELDWETILLQMQESHDANVLFTAVQRGKGHYQPIYLLEAYFWSRSLPSAQYLKRLPKLTTIRKLAGKTLHRHGPHAFFFECAVHLEDCYDNGIPLDIRLAGLRDIMGRLGRLRTVDKELLVLAAYARWLSRFHQPFLASLALNEYRSLSWKLSSGAQADVLSVADSIDSNAWQRFLPDKRPAQEATSPLSTTRPTRSKSPA